MRSTLKKPSDTPHAVCPGAQVTFKGLPEPIMIVVAIDWKKNLAICRYHDDFANKSIRLECAADTLAPAAQQT